MEEIKALLIAIIENQQVTNAKLDAMEMRQAKFEGETKGSFEDLQKQFDYIAGKLGEHDRDLYVLKRNQG
ncbi:hypothetical protein [Paenibacillus popilliae]|uniref:hypothetical protein n=1 Tax=Paenibacillus popilliae TaxID=78057 RepID=UPI0011D24CAF|nr:hypothetical protein [Paenibacillus popilliae]